MKILNYIFLVVAIIGALNWGLFGLFNFNLVAMLFGGATSIISKIVYVLVGISGLWSLSFFSKLNDEI
ncbi:MAG: DUF378 domain-containing protein [Clostridia bacterium]